MKDFFERELKLSELLQGGFQKVGLLLFARVGWMRWYRGPQAGDERPIGGGKYNRESLGHEAYNFLPLNGKLLGYFQPQLQPPEAEHESVQHRDGTNQARFDGGTLKNVLTVFLATDPERGGQRIVGWFRSSTVYRYAQDSSLKAREYFSYYIEATEGDEVLVPEDRREFVLPGGKGGAGTANVCYVLELDGQQNSRWIAEAIDYIDSYALENASQDPASETDAAIAGDTRVLLRTQQDSRAIRASARLSKTMRWTGPKST